MKFDLNGDNQLDHSDRDTLIQVILATNYGDANLDGRFDQNDLGAVLAAGEYEDSVLGNSSWGEGDWDCDGDFTVEDILLASQQGEFLNQSANAQVATLNQSHPNAIASAINHEPPTARDTSRRKTAATQRDADLASGRLIDRYDPLAASRANIIFEKDQWNDEQDLTTLSREHHRTRSTDPSTQMIPAIKNAIDENPI